MVRPKIKKDYKRDDRVFVSYNKHEMERLDKIVKTHDCNGRADLIRRASIGDIVIDLKKIERKKA